MKMMRETPIAFAFTMVLCLALFFYCWYARKLRHRRVSVQVSTTPDEVQEKTGIEKAVVDSFPTIKTLELIVNIKDELQCPICLVEYSEEETLRKLPHCGHVFHIPCVDSWLANQVTCPVCRVELTGTAKLPKRERRVQQSAYYRIPATATSVTVAAPPAWILVNRPAPLPPAGYSESHNYDLELQSSDSKLGLGFRTEPLRVENAGWGATFLQKSISTVEFGFQSQTAENAVTESFSFDNLSGYGGEKALDIAEMYRRSTTHGHLPLTVSPEHCVFEFLPIVTSRGRGQLVSIAPPQQANKTIETRTA